MTIVSIILIIIVIFAFVFRKENNIDGFGLKKNTSVLTIGSTRENENAKRNRPTSQ